MGLARRTACFIFCFVPFLSMSLVSSFCFLGGSSNHFSFCQDEAVLSACNKQIARWELFTRRFPYKGMSRWL